jgi:hypothetical protein
MIPAWVQRRLRHSAGILLGQGLVCVAASVFCTVEGRHDCQTTAPMTVMTNSDQVTWVYTYTFDRLARRM